MELPLNLDLILLDAPKITRTNNIGNNQYFFLTIKNSQNSFKNGIVKIDVSLNL